MYLKDLLTQWDQFEIPPDIQKQCHRATEGIRDLYKKFIETSVTVGIIPKDETTEASIYAMGLTMHLAKSSVLIAYQFGKPDPDKEITNLLKEACEPCAKVFADWLAKYAQEKAATQEEVIALGEQIGKLLYNTALDCYRVGLTTKIPLPKLSSQ
jgi:hypothetical protein